MNSRYGHQHGDLDGCLHAPSARLQAPKATLRDRFPRCLALRLGIPVASEPADRDTRRLYAFDMDRTLKDGLVTAIAQVLA